MSDLDELPLVRGSGGTPLGYSSQTRKLPVVLIAALGLGLGAIGAWWWSRGAPAPERPAAPTAATDAALSPAEARPLPPLGQMDTFLRALIGALSSSPELARWLATDNLIQQMAHAIDLVSRGASPAKEVAVLRPDGVFAVTGSSRQSAIDPATYRRFDGLANLVASLDARAVAEAYRTIQPRLDEAYRGLGRTEGSVDQAVLAALQTLIDTPQVDGPIRVVPGAGATYAYADPALEKLPAAQKQLLRMGPQNLEKIRTRLIEIQRGLGIRD